MHVQGSSRWVGFGPFRLQPSELMKLALTDFCADLIAKRLDAGAPDRRIIGPLLLVTGCAGVLIVAQPDMGTAMVLACVAVSMLFVSGVSLRPVLKVLAGLIGMAIIVAVASPYRRVGSSPSSTRRRTAPGRGTRWCSRSLVSVPATSTAPVSAAGRRSGASCPTRTPTSSSR